MIKFWIAGLVLASMSGLAKGQDDPYVKNASDCAIYKGKSFRGTLDDSFLSDNIYLQFEADDSLDVRRPQISVIFSCIAPGADFQSVDFTLEQGCDDGCLEADLVHSLKIEAYNFFTRRWQTMSNSWQSVSDDDTVTHLTFLPVGLIHPLTQQMMTRITWGGDGNPMTDARVDQVIWHFVPS